MTVRLEHEFTPKEDYSLRSIDGKWLLRRGEELAKVAGTTEPETWIALEEAVDVLKERAGNNLAEGRDILIYPPENPEDPYLVALPLLLLSKRQPRKPKEPAKPKRVFDAPIDSKLLIEEQFEQALAAREEGIFPSQLRKGSNGEYADPKIQAMWEGFKLYHDGMLSVPAEAWEKRFEKALGQWVVARIGDGGTPLFIKAPYRHSSKHKAMEEAQRLANSGGNSFAVFKCLDVAVPAVYEKGIPV